MTGPLAFGAGSAASPALHVVGDTNTGIWQSAADNLDIATGGTNRVNISSTGLAVTGAVTASTRVGIGGGSSPSYALHIANSDTLKMSLNHTATTSTRALAVNRRNSSDNGVLEWHQEFSTGDAPTWNFVRVNRPDGSGAAFLTAVQIGWSGNIWIADDCSAKSFTDRTPYPDKATAMASVRSMRRKGKAGLDHAALHSYVKAKAGDGRDLSATVSAQNVVIQDLLERLEKLEAPNAKEKTL